MLFLSPLWQPRFIKAGTALPLSQEDYCRKGTQRTQRTAVMTFLLCDLCPLCGSIPFICGLSAVRCHRSGSRSFARHFSPCSLRLSAQLGKKGNWLRLAARGLLSLFAANQPKFLSTNHLHLITWRHPSGPIVPIKPNRAIFIFPAVSSTKVNQGG